uniref:Claudin n=1 Tax=Seriola dumerili TaxID=41447 RepID=A0A3B4UZR3_SERDU
MASLGLQILGVGLAVLGWIGNILICMLPLWKVSAFIGNNIVVAQSIWEGLWMTCVVQSTGQMQCKVYDSLLALPPDLQAARAMVVIAILFSLFGLLLSVVGGKCTTRKLLPVVVQTFWVEFLCSQTKGGRLRPDIYNPCFLPLHCSHTYELCYPKQGFKTGNNGCRSHLYSHTYKHTHTDPLTQVKP